MMHAVFVMHFRTSLRLSTAAALCTAGLFAQSKTAVIPSGLGFESRFGEAYQHAPGAGGGFLALYDTSAVGIPDRTVVREIAFRPPSYTHGATKRSFSVAIGYPAAGIRPETMPLDRSRIVAGGLAGLTYVARNVIVSMPAFSPINGLAPFGVRIPVTPFQYDASRRGLVVQILGQQVGGDNSGYFIDKMKRDSDASEAAIGRLNSSCRGSTGYSSFLEIYDKRSWVPGGHATVRLQGFSTSQALLFFGTAVDNRFPVILTSAGMPGCTLWTLPEVLMPVRLNRFVRSYNNFAVLTLPSNPALTGARLRMQAIEFDLLANARGLTTSSGLDVVLGKAGTRKYVARSIQWLGTNYPELIDSAEGAPILRLSY